MRRRLALVILVAACGGTAQPATTTLAPPDPSTVPDLIVPRQLEGLDVVALDLGERRLVLAVGDHHVDHVPAEPGIARAVGGLISDADRLRFRGIHP